LAMMRADRRSTLFPYTTLFRSAVDGKMADDVKMQRIAGHSEDRFLGSDVFESAGRSISSPRRGGTVREDARDIDVYHKCDVLVRSEEHTSELQSRENLVCRLLL